MKIRKLNKETDLKEEILVLASDGLWDMLSDQEVSEFVLKWVRIQGLSPTEAAEKLIEEALKKSAAKHKLSLEELKALKQGRTRRNKHDDMTVIVVDLSQLMELFYFG